MEMPANDPEVATNGILSGVIPNLAIRRLGEIELRYLRGVGEILTQKWHELPRDVLIE
jgi:hypothetical protein